MGFAFSDSAEAQRRGEKSKTSSSKSATRSSSTFQHSPAPPSRSNIPTMKNFQRPKAHSFNTKPVSSVPRAPARTFVTSPVKPAAPKASSPTRSSSSRASSSLSHRSRSSHASPSRSSHSSHARSHSSHSSSHGSHKSHGHHSSHRSHSKSGFSITFGNHKSQRVPKDKPLKFLAPDPVEANENGVNAGTHLRNRIRRAC